MESVLSDLTMVWGPAGLWVARRIGGLLPKVLDRCGSEVWRPSVFGWGRMPSAECGTRRL
jgi:hypothetical protein